MSNLAVTASTTTVHAPESSPRSAPPPPPASEPRPRPKAKTPRAGAASLQQQQTEPLEDLLQAIERAMRTGTSDARERIARAVGVQAHARLLEGAREALTLAREVDEKLKTMVALATYAAGDIHGLLRNPEMESVERECIGDQLAATRADFDVAMSAAHRSLLSLGCELTSIEMELQHQRPRRAPPAPARVA